MNIKLLAVGSRPWEKWLGYWGLSCLVDDSILFDTFYSYPVLARKMHKAGVDPESIRSVVISHDHWDHVGGLWKFLEKRQGADIYLPPSAKDSVKQQVIASGGRLIDMTGLKTLKENVFLSDEMMGEFKGGKVAEQFLAIKGSKGITLLVGCSHASIINIVQKAKETFNAPVYGVIGGFHLMNAKADAVYACASTLKNEGIQMIAPTHCTGWRAEKIFKQTFGKGFVTLQEGQTLAL